MMQAIGFAPDMDSTTQGIFTDCDNVDPTTDGFAASPSFQDSGAPALAAPCVGAAVLKQINSSSRLIAGTGTKLFELTGNTWTDRSRTANYTIGDGTRWRFAQMGNAIVAANTQDVLQASTGEGFSDISGAPSARIIESVAGFIMALATNDPVNGDQADRWWCSALYDYSDWTPAAETQCANGRLLDVTGPIVAGRALGDNIVAYKDDSMFLGSYLGPPIIWSWQRVPGNIGAVSHESVVSVGTAHLFYGASDFWLYDGSRPVSIGAPVREWFNNNASRDFIYKMQGYYDSTSAIVYWFYVSSQSDGEIDSCLTYNLKTGKWGKSRRAIQAVLQYLAPGVVFDDLGSLYATYNDITGISYDSPRWFKRNQQLGAFDETNNLRLLGGTALASSITTCDVGDDYVYSTLTRAACRFRSQPTSGYGSHLHRRRFGDDMTVAEQSNISDGKMDFLLSDRWHRVKVNLTGAMTLTGYDLTLVPDGNR